LKRTKDEDIFEEIEDPTEEVEELTSHVPRFRDDDLDDEFEDPDALEDAEELERRRAKYSELKKVDKIFNNSYNMGQVAGEEIEEPRSNTPIRLDTSSPDYHMYDRDQHSDYIDNAITQIDIHEFVSKSDEVQAILGPDPDKKKFNKTEVNDLFLIIKEGVSKGAKSSVFVSPIHVLDSISSLTGLEYKKLFDMMIYENKEILLLELDKKYTFLDKPAADTKMYE